LISNFFEEEKVPPSLADNSLPLKIKKLIQLFKDVRNSAISTEDFRNVMLKIDERNDLLNGLKITFEEMFNDLELHLPHEEYYEDDFKMEMNYFDELLKLLKEYIIEQMQQMLVVQNQLEQLKAFIQDKDKTKRFIITFEPKLSIGDQVLFLLTNKGQYTAVNNDEKNVYVLEDSCLQQISGGELSKPSIIVGQILEVQQCKDEGRRSSTVWECVITVLFKIY